jgi:hypothetical protein
LLSSLKPRAKARVSVSVAVVSAFFLGAGAGAVIVARHSQSSVSAAAEAAKAGYRAASAQHAVIAPAVATPQALATLAALPVVRSAPQTQTLTPYRDLECLTDAVYYEARGESLEGQAAVAQVVLNRARAPHYPKSVCGVVFQGVGTGGCQFSFACNGAMTRPVELTAWGRARAVAGRALAGYVMDAVGSAVHFHGTHLAAGELGQDGAVAHIGGHVFSNESRPVAMAAASRTSIIGRQRAVRVVRGDVTDRVVVALDKETSDTPPTRDIASE